MCVIFPILGQESGSRDMLGQDLLQLTVVKRASNLLESLLLVASCY